MTKSSKQTQPVSYSLDDVAVTLDLEPVTLDFETRSTVDLKRCGGHKYAVSSTTSVLSLVALDRVADTAIVWTPGMEEPVPPDLCVPNDFPKSAVRPRVIQSFAGPDVPDCLTCLARTRPFAGHNCFAFDCLIWHYTCRQPEPAHGWIDTMLLARAAALPGSLDKCGKYLLNTGKDKGKAVLHSLCKPLKTGQFIPVNSRNIVPVVQYNLIDTVIQDAIYQHAKWALTQGRELEVMLMDRVRGQRGLPGDVKLAETMLPLWRNRIAEKIDDAARLTAGLAEADRVDGTLLRNPAGLLAWLRRRGIYLPNLQKGTVTEFLRIHGTDLPDETDSDDEVDLTDVVDNGPESPEEDADYES